MILRANSKSRRRDKSARKAWRLLVETLETRALLAGPTLIVSPAVDVSKLPGNQSETSVAINPTNPKNVVVLSNRNDGTTGLFYGVSFDGGTTFATSTLATGTDFPAACCDPSAVFDSFGNLFVDYIDAGVGTAYILTSADGGKTFKQIESVPANDQPKLATGPGGAPGTDSIWMEYLDGNNLIGAVGAPITGLGQVGAFITPLEVSDEPGGDGNFGKPAVGPNGQFMVSYESPSGGAGPAVLNEAFDPQGLAGKTFQPSVLISNTNVGGFDPIPPQPQRTVDAEIALAYDSSGGPFNGRLYAVYTDAPAPSSAASDIFLRHSDNNGATWSAPVKVTDDTSGRSKFMPRIAIDQTTGNIAMSWYDSRNDATDTSAEFFATVSVDGGQTFAPNVQVSLGPSNVAAAGNNSGNDFGDFTGLDFTHGVFYSCWTDNSPQLPGNPDPNNFDIALAEVQVANPITPTILPIQLLEGQTFSGTVGTFTTSIPGTTAASFTASMDFGNGAIVPGTITGPDANGVYTVTASNLYAEGGTFTTTLTITGPGNVSAAVSGTATIADAAISAVASPNATTIEGSPAPTQLGTFTDADLSPISPTDYTVSLLWDDGATTTGTVQVDPVKPGVFDIFGSHPQEDGAHDVQVSMIDQGGATANFTTNVTVTDALLTPGAPLAFNAFAGLAFQGPVATFTDANPDAFPEDYLVRIHWDATHTTFGTITFNGVSHVYTVSGDFIYGAPGTDNVSVTIDDSGGATATATATAKVADAELQSTVTLPFQSIVGATIQGNVGEFTYADLQANASFFPTVVINWGDGSPNTGGSVVAAGNGAFFVQGAHAYHSTGSFGVSAVVTDIAGNSVTALGAATVVDAPIHVGVVAFQPIQLIPFDGGVAFFTSQNQFATPATFMATINWGDGTTNTPGIVTADPKGGYDVFGSHTYAQDQLYTVAVTIDSSEGSKATATGPVTPLTTIVPVAGSLNPASNSGPSNSDDITNVTAPNFLGHAAPFAEVSLFSIQGGQSAPVPLGQVQADADGAWNLTVGTPFIDGAYVILASAVSANGHPDSPLAPILAAPLIIDTTAPIVAASLLEPRAGQIEIAFVDYGSGMNMASLINSFAYGITVTLPGRAPKPLPSIPDGLLIPSPGVYVLMLGVGRVSPGSVYNLAIASPFVIDNAGNPLDGSFTGGFPSGNGHPGSLFQAEFVVASNATVIAQPIFAASDLSGALAHENLLSAHTGKPRTVRIQRRRG